MTGPGSSRACRASPPGRWTPSAEGAGTPAASAPEAHTSAWTPRWAARRAGRAVSATAPPHAQLLGELVRVGIVPDVRLSAALHPGVPAAPADEPGHLHLDPG